MIRLLFFLAAVLILGAAMAWLADHPGQVRIDWEGWRIDTSMAFVALMGGAALLGGMGVQALWGWLRRDMPFFGANRHLDRQRRGLDALNQAVVALASGDPRRARRLSDRARRLLPPQPLTHVLSAQAARLAGDEAAATAQFQALMKDPAAAFIGMRGLITAAVREGRTNEALRLVREAAEKEPDSPWAVHTRLGLEVRAGLWNEAAESLEKARKLKVFERADYRRHQAALLYAEAREVETSGQRDAAAEKLARALRLRPGFPAAAVLLARLQRATVKAGGRPKSAAHTLERAFTAMPHPELVEAYFELDPTERPTERYRRLKGLTKKAPDHIESRLALGRQALRAEHETEAREILETLRAEAPLGRILRALAELARGLDGDAARAAALEQAAGAAADYRWVCGSCGQETESWHPCCAACGAFDSQEWQCATSDAVPQLAGAPAAVGGNLELLPDSLAEMVPPPPDVEPAPGEAE